ncbi:hypothetical protein BW723_10560 [Polaribacter reichenbachii]|uniref:DUF6973 domain-containing protein n=1 Tax=Polaribacter reichenbachii TaxID=996801 RepID=A0A1B8TQ20_9FLAO|nr:hypothetical protein [Polaribacter reichenbachii]APZ46701.1 hypothetical protein BW723_10560 [Polaribacter reichenbachii]AUC17344.1 hypothetical protein BTO17_01005 [Polaribacter reichenbachii]OBY61780.1 hypothetical protein LPB301_17195 [Polaribacter reichenbachii]
MSKWKIIKSLNFKQVIVLLGWFLKHPIFMYATFRATVKTLRIAQKRFPNTHNFDNKANAFRHALWNILIAKKCLKFSSDLEQVLTWTKQITGWHEEFSPNEILAKKMDLKNNQLGRKWFSILKNESILKIEEYLIEKLCSAIKINFDSPLDKIDNLVFLED